MQPLRALSGHRVIDLVGLPENDARVSLLGAFSEQAKPTFPGAAADAGRTQPQRLAPDYRFTELEAEGYPGATSASSRSVSRALSRADSDKVCDVCVFCALWDEIKTVREVFSKLSDVTFVQDYTARGTAFLKAKILNEQQETLIIHLSWLPEMGGMRASAQFDATLAEFKPRFAGMTGICAADRASAALGDLVIAKFAYEYGAGKIVIGEDGMPKLKPEIETFGPKDTIVQWVQNFETWKNDVAALRRPTSKQQQADWLLSQLLNPETPRIADIPIELRSVYAPVWQQILIELRASVAERPAVLTDDGALRAPEALRKRKEEDRFFPYRDPSEATAHVMIMGSGPAVRSDYPFPMLQKVERKLGAIDMEAASRAIS
jgi:nucleoside phosphorylase